MRNYLYKILVFFLLFSCEDIYEDFPVPEASTVPQFSYEIVDESNRIVEFTNESIIPESAGEASYTWSFGDGSNSSEASPTHTYTSFGEYTVKLVVITSSGDIVETSKVINIIQPIDIDFSLFYMDTDLMQIISVGQVNQEIPVSGFGTGIAIDRENEKIYFVDDDNLEILRSDLDGSNTEVLYSGLTGATNLTLDTDNNQVFWTNRVDGTVHRGSMDGTIPEETIINSLALPEGIAYFNGKIYISDVQVPPIGENIYVANANGTNLEVYVPGSWGYGLAVDPVNERLYFGDQGVYDDPNDNRLRSVSLSDNTDIITVSEIEPIGSNGSRTYGIFVKTDENKVYWSDRNSQKIKRSNLDGSDVEVLVVSEGSPRGLAYSN